MWEVFGSDSEENESDSASSSSGVNGLRERVAAAKLSQPQPQPAPPSLPRPTLPSKRTAQAPEPWLDLIPQLTEQPRASAGEPCPPSQVAMWPSAPPLFQSAHIAFSASMPHRGGGRGLVATTDIAPGTLLLAETPCAAVPTAAECDAVAGMGDGAVRQEELCLWRLLQRPPAEAAAVLRDLAFLHPQSLDELLPERLAALTADHAAAVRELQEAAADAATVAAAEQGLATGGAARGRTVTEGVCLATANSIQAAAQVEAAGTLESALVSIPEDGALALPAEKIGRVGTTAPRGREPGDTTPCPAGAASGSMPAAPVPAQNGGGAGAQSAAMILAALAEGPRPLLRLLCALRFNAFQGGLSMHMSMLNHSCIPNSVKLTIAGGNREGDHGGNSGNGDSGGGARSEVWSVRPIPAGEDITINYLGAYDYCRSVRRERLRVQFAFDCDCPLCAVGAAAEGAVPTLPRQEHPVVGNAAAAAVTVSDRERRRKCQPAAALAARTATETNAEEEAAEQLLVLDRLSDEATVEAEASLRRCLDEWEGEVNGGDGGSSDSGGDSSGGGVSFTAIHAVVAAAVAAGLDRRHLTVVRAHRVAAAAAMRALSSSFVMAAGRPSRALNPKVGGAVNGSNDFAGRAGNGSHGGGGGAGGDQGMVMDPVRVAEALLMSLLEVRRAQTLLLGSGPHPDVAILLADAGRASALLLGAGRTGAAALQRVGAATSAFSPASTTAAAAASASRFERACVAAALAVDRAFEVLPPAYVAACGSSPSLPPSR